MNLRRNLQRYINLYNYVEAYRNIHTLPSGYTELEYIESSGTQYINIGNPFTTNNNIIEAGFVPLSSDNGRYVFGAMNTSPYVGFVLSQSGKFSVVNNNSLSATVTDVTYTLGDYYDIILKNSSVGSSAYINGKKTALQIRDIPTSDMIISAHTYGGTTLTENTRFFYFRTYDDNILTHDLVPAKRNSDDAIGMYDRVTNTFFGNAGTGSFIAGGYTKLEYIESTGTQYINTGLTTNANTKVEAVIGKNTQLVTGDNGIFGNGNFGCRWDSANVFRGGFGSTTWQNTTVTQLDKNTIQFGSGNFKYNNQTLTIGTGAAFSSDSMLLFAITTAHTSATRVYEFKVYQNNNLVMDLIPVQRNSDNAICMYDTITKQYFTNQGTDNFVAGPESLESSELVLQDAIKDSLKSLKAYGKTKLKPDILLDTVVANGGTEILSHDYMDSITAKGKTEQRKLPVGYQELEYIQTDINSYIDTGIAGNVSGNRYKVGFSRISVNGSSCNGIIGTHNLTEPYGRSYVGSRNSTWEYGYGSSTTGGSISNNTYYDIDLNTTNGKYLLDINGTNEVNVTDTNARSTAHILINTVYNATSTYTGIAKYYYVKIYDQDNTTLIMNLVPARNASGVVGMYDTVSCTFFTNSGTGSFVAGPVVNLPEEYERIEYIESTGSQAIDTGVKYSGNNFVVEWEAKDTSSSNSTLFAATKEQPYSGGLYGSKSDRKYYVGGSGQTINYISNDDKYHKWKLIMSGQTATLYKDSTQVGTASMTGTVDTIHDIYLFCGGWTDQSNPTLTQFASWSLKSWKLTDDGVVKFDAIPVKSSDGTIGLFDMISGNFLTNAGTGTFTAGPSLNVPSNYTILDYIESTGTQYIDTGIKDIVNSEFEITAQQTTISGTFPTIVGAVDGDTASPVTDYKVIVGLSTADNKYYTQTGGTNGYHVSNIPNDTNKHKFNVKVGTNQTILTIDDTNVYPGSYTVTTTQKYSLFICARNKSTISNFTQQKVFGFTARKNGTLISNLVPVIRNSDGVIGMYDTVSGTLLTNQGTGSFKAGYKANILPDNPVDIYCNNGALKVNLNLYWTEYHGYELSQVDGITTRENSGVNVSGIVDCRTIKSFKITTVSPQGAFRIFKYRADNTFINASSTANIGDIITIEDNVSFFRIQYNFTSGGVDTENILIYNSVCNLGEIYTEGTTETIYKYGKNLFNEKWNKDTGTSTQSSTWGQVVTASGWSTSELIPVVAGKKYTVSYSTNIDRQYVFYYNADGTMQQSYNDTTNPTLTVTIPANCTHVRLQCHKSGTALDSIQTQLEVGSNTTTYEPYTHDAEIATCEDLFGLYSYQDTQNILNGNINRNINILVLKGTENWAAGATGRYYLNITPAYVKAQYTPLCSHFQMYTEPGGTGDMAVPNMLALYVGSVDAYQLYAYPNSTVGATVNTWKAWLAQQYAAGTPVMIIYPLATATSETVSKQINNKETGDTIEVIAGSLENLEVTNTSSTHTIPLPDYPLDINCNNGVLKVSKNLFDKETLLDGYIADDGTIMSSSISAYSGAIPVTPNTTYVLSGATLYDNNAAIRIHGYSAQDTWVEMLKKVTTSTPTEITNPIVFTTGSTDYFIRVSYVRDNMQDIQIEQGSVVTPYMSYGSIYTDGTVETINAHGKNLFDITALAGSTTVSYFGDTITITGGTNVLTGKTLKQLCPEIKAGKTYYLSMSSNSTTSKRYIWLRNGATGGQWTNNTAKTLSQEDLDGGVKMYCDTVGQTIVQMQIEQGTSATAYEPYFNSGTATAEMLLKVGTYTDTQDVISGTVTRNVQTLVLNGTENWITSGGCYYLADIFKGLNTINGSLCTHFTTSDTNNHFLDLNIDFGGVKPSNLFVRYDAMADVTAFKAFLADQYAAGTPVIVVYPLATATTETVDKQRMRKGIVSITEASMTNLTVNTTESVHTIPAPDFPLDLYSSNGVLKENTATSGVNEIIATDIVDGYLNCTVGQPPVINSSTASQIIKHALRVKAGKSYKFSYISALAGNRESDVIGDDGLAKEKVTLICSVGLNEYTITPNNNGELWLTIQSGDLVTVNPICYEIGKVAGSGTPEVLTVTGKNLFDIDSQLLSRAGYNTCVAVSNEQMLITSQVSGGAGGIAVNVDTNKTYTLSFKRIGDATVVIYEVDNISSTTFPTTTIRTTVLASNENIKTITPYNSNVKYFIIAVASGGSATVGAGIEKVQLEEGTRPTQYENYMNINCSVEDLLSVGDYQDIKDLKADIINRNVGVKVLDGTESWIKTPNYTNLYELSLKNEGALSGEIMFALTSTHLIGTAEVNANMPDNSIKLTTRGVDRTDPLVFIKTSQGNDTLVGFEQFLADQYAAGTPVIIVYPLATETTESTITQSVDIVSGTNTIERNSEYLNDLGVDAEFKKLR